MARHRVMSGGLLAGLSLFVSCREDAVVGVAEVPATLTEDLSYVIPVEEALASLDDFLNDPDGLQTRSGGEKPKVAQVYSLEHPESQTRSTKESAHPSDRLLYVANFEEGAGFAVLAADRRIGDKVIAVTESGTLPKGAMTDAAKELAGERRVYEKYPLEGEGFFNIPEYPEEMFMNPNTVDLSIVSEQDTLVGNFEEEEEASPARSKFRRVAGEHEDDRGARLLGTYFFSYAIHELEGHRSGGGSGTVRKEVSVRTVYQPWETSTLVSPILHKYWSWRQDSPFNDLYPHRRKFIVAGKKKKAPAGCFPLSIAKVEAHFEAPQTIVHNGTHLSWTALRQGMATEAGRTSLATLLYHISEGCKSWYFYAGTFTFPCRAVNFMKASGYRNVKKQRYSDAKVYDMLQRGCPVIIYAIPRWNVPGSHCWNIDGYRIRERKITDHEYVNGVLNKSTVRTETTRMVHCDFGWGGLCNGYFVTGVFDFRDSDVVFDDPYHKGKRKEKYNNYIHIVTYDKP